MFRIIKGFVPSTYSVSCYMYIKEARFHSFLYSVENITGADVVRLLLGRVSGDEEDLSWALDIARLTNCSAVFGEDGRLVACPIKTIKKEKTNERPEPRQAQSYS